MKRGKVDEVNTLADWCECMHRFIFDRSLAFRPGFEDMLEVQLSGTRNARARGDLRGLRMVHRDLTEAARDLPAKDREELDGILRQRFGRGLESAEEEIALTARKIIERGVIDNAEEFRILEAWLNVLLEDPSKRGEAEEVSILLARVRAPLAEQGGSI
jgi:hypothetical protein